MLSCGDNVLFAGLVAPEGEVSDFPAALMDPGTLATIVNFRWVDAEMRSDAIHYTMRLQPGSRCEGDAIYEQ